MKETTQPSTLKSIIPWLLWCLGALFYFYEFLIQVAPSVMVPNLMSSFSISATSIGILGSFYFTAYASMQMPVGVMLDNIGPRRLLAAASLVCAIGSLMFGLSHSFAVACLARALTGLGSAFAAIGCLHLAASWLPLRRFALITGLTLTVGMLGAVFGQAPVALMVESLGWRNTMIIFGFIGIGISLLIITFVRDRQLQSDPNFHPETARHLLTGLKQVVSSRQTWLIGIYGCLMYIPTAVFGSQWGVPFIMERTGLSRPISATIVSLFFIGWAVGAPIFGWLSDFIKRRLPILGFASFTTLLVLCVILYVPHVTHVAMGLLLFTFGFVISAFLPAFSLAREINLPENNATSLGFVNMGNMLGGAIAQPAVGGILDLAWNGMMHHGIRAYATSDFQLALTILPVCCLLALIITPFINETHCKTKYQIVRS